MNKILLLSLFLLLFTKVDAQNYYLKTSADGIEELYIMSVTSNRINNSITVFDRLKPVDGKLPDFRKNAKNNADKETDTESFEKLDYYRRKVQLSCKARKYRIMEITYYDMNGKEMEKTEFSEEERAWLSLPKGSLIEAEFIKVCNM
jgi:hypothetical protein